MKIENKTVVSAIADMEKVTLFFDDGESMNLPSNQDFTREVVDIISPALAQGKHITLNMEAKRLDVFQMIERKSSGLVKLFRVAKKALLGGGDEPTEEFVRSIALPMGAYALNNQDETIVAVIQNSEEAEELAVIDPDSVEAAGLFHDAMVANGGTNEGMGNVSSAEAADRQESQEPAQEPATVGRNEGVSNNPVAPDTSVGQNTSAAPQPAPAKVQAKPTSSVVAGVEHLATQMKHFSEKDNPQGFIRFMQRIGAVVNERKHSVDDLLHFLSKGDLPIADDGSIIAYKRLLSEKNGYFVDSHSRSVRQKLGSHVFMDPAMVDPDRNHECSYGLHIGRRDYMGSFYGDTIIICKIAPEDVIAVPRDYGRSKMRCCGYKIVGIVSPEGMEHLINHRPMTDDPKMAALLAQIIAGNHTEVVETTEIRKSGGILVTPVVNGRVSTSANEVVVPVEPVKALETVETLEDHKIDPAINSPEAIKKKATPKAPEKPAEIKKAEATGDPRKVKKAKRKAVPKAPEPVKAKAPVIAQEGDMTEAQMLAKKRWPEVKAGTLSKVKLAKECNTSTRSLDRWEEKFNF